MSLRSKPISMFLCLWTLFPSIANGEVVVSDPYGAVSLIEQNVRDWTFEQAFRLGDKANKYEQYCDKHSDKWRCSFLPSTSTVMALDADSATIEHKFDGMSASRQVVTRAEFEATKNFLAYSLAKTKCRFFQDDQELPCKLSISEPVIYQRTLNDGKSISGFMVEYQLEEIRGRMVVGIGLPWVARVVHLELPGWIVPEAILVGFDRN